MTKQARNGDQMENAFVLQDRKRLPARFFASISGALNTRAA